MRESHSPQKCLATLRSANFYYSKITHKKAEQVYILSAFSYSSNLILPLLMDFPVNAPFHELDQAFVSQVLQLLADFGSYVVILRMQDL